MSSSLPHFVYFPAELSILDLPDEEESVMESDLHLLALPPPPHPGLLSELVYHVSKEGAKVIVFTVLDNQQVNQF